MVGQLIGRRTGGIVLIALTLLLAGCSGQDLGNRTILDDVRDGVEAQLDDTDESTPTATEEPTETETPSDGNLTEFEHLEDDHRELLRDAGSFTKHEVVNATVTGVANFSDNGTERAQINLDTGEAFVHDETGDGQFEQYRNASGAVISRSGSGDSATYRGPESNFSINTTEYVTTGMPVLPRDTNVTVNESRTVNGLSGTVYTVSGLDALNQPSQNDSDSNESVQNGSDSSGYNLTAFEFTAVADDAGYVSWYRVDIVLENDNITIDQTVTVSYTDVGSTDVAEPAWLDDAKSEINRPDPDDIVTQTYNATGDMGRVELAVTGRYGDLNGSGAGIEIVEDPSDGTSTGDEARYGSFARVHYPTDGVRNVTITFHRAPFETPDFNETFPMVASYDESLGQWDYLNTSMDGREGTTWRTLEDPELIREHDGRVVSVLDLLA